MSFETSVEAYNNEIMIIEDIATTIFPRVLPAPDVFVSDAKVWPLVGGLVGAKVGPLVGTLVGA